MKVTLGSGTVKFCVPPGKEICVTDNRSSSPT